MVTGVRDNSTTQWVGTPVDIASDSRPVAANVFIDTQGTPYDVAAPGLLQGATYSVISAITIVSAPTNGDITAIGLDGSFTYTYTGVGLPDTDSFTFTITDENGTSDVANGTINALAAIVNNLKVVNQYIDGRKFGSSAVSKVYDGGELVYGESTPISTGGRIEFAQVPPIVLPAGYPYTIDFNIFIVDPDNLPTPGQMPWDGDVATMWPDSVGTASFIVADNGFTPAKLADLVFAGSLPTGVSWSKATNTLIYDGTSPATDEIVSVYLSYEGKISNTFEIQLIIPRLIWPNAIDESLNTQVYAMYATYPTDRYPLVVVLDGDYTINSSPDGTALKTGAEWTFNCFDRQDYVYWCGEPGTMPMLSGIAASGWSDPYLTSSLSAAFKMLITQCIQVHFNGLYFRAHGEIKQIAKTVLLNVFNCRFSNHSNNTFFGITRLEADRTEAFETFFTNVEAFWEGSGGVKHFLYLESGAVYPWLRGVIPWSKSYINNYKNWEAGRPNGINTEAGGEGFKTIERYTEVRNICVSHFREPLNPARTTWKGSHAINLTVHSSGLLSNALIYNMEHQQNTLNFDGRNLTNGGQYYPPYHSYPKMYFLPSVDYPPEERFIDNSLWAEAWGLEDDEVTKWYTTKDSTYHGTTNAANDYSKNGESYLSVGATVPAPGLLSGATIDPTGVTAITPSVKDSEYKVNVDDSLDGSFFISYHLPVSTLPNTLQFTFTITDINGLSAPATITCNFDTGGAAATAGALPTYADTGLPPVVINQTYDVFNVDIDAMVLNDTPIPGAAPFWDSVGDPTDYNNTNEYINHFYVSNVEIYSIDTGATDAQRAAVNVRAPLPTAINRAFGSLNAILPAPTNWKPLNHVFLCNIKMDGYDYLANPNLYIYNNPRWNTFNFTYPGHPVDVENHEITLVGGIDKDDGTAFITLPEWFKT